MKGYGLNSYYTPHMTGLLVDSQLFSRLLSEQLPSLSAHFLRKENGSIDCLLFLTQWFMSMFTSLSILETVLNVWDAFFYEGTYALIRLSLAILKCCEKELLQLQGNLTNISLIIYPKRYSYFVLICFIYLFLYCFYCCYYYIRSGAIDSLFAFNTSLEYNAFQTVSNRILPSKHISIHGQRTRYLINQLYPTISPQTTIGRSLSEDQTKQ